MTQQYPGEPINVDWPYPFSVVKKLYPIVVWRRGPSGYFDWCERRGVWLFEYDDI